jgi:hypothetical protein
MPPFFPYRDIVKGLPDRKPREPCVMISGLRKVYPSKPRRLRTFVLLTRKVYRNPSQPETPLGTWQVDRWARIQQVQTTPPLEINYEESRGGCTKSLDRMESYSPIE